MAARQHDDRAQDSTCDEWERRDVPMGAVRSIHRTVATACAICCLLMLWPLQARASGVPELLPDEVAAGMLIGAAATGGVLLAYAVVGVEYDGIFIPPALAGVQFGAGIAMLVVSLALANDDPSSDDGASAAEIGLGMTGVLLAHHAGFSFFAWDPKQPAGELALTSDLASSISVRWRRAF